MKKLTKLPALQSMQNLIKNGVNTSIKVADVVAAPDLIRIRVDREKEISNNFGESC